MESRPRCDQKNEQNWHSVGAIAGEENERSGDAIATDAPALDIAEIERIHCGF